MADINEPGRLVGHCGIYCGGCGIYKGRVIRMVAEDLKELIESYGCPEWVPKLGKIDFKFKEFQKGLDYFTKEDSRCYTRIPCKEGCGAPDCKIKDCAKNRQIELCFECDDFPCDNFSQFTEDWRTGIVKEQERFKKLGVAEWIKLQTSKAEKGYCESTGKYYTKAKPQ